MTARSKDSPIECNSMVIFKRRAKTIVPPTRSSPRRSVITYAAKYVVIKTRRTWLRRYIGLIEFIEHLVAAAAPAQVELRPLGAGLISLIRRWRAYIDALANIGISVDIIDIAFPRSGYELVRG